MSPTVLPSHTLFHLELFSFASLTSLLLIFVRWLVRVRRQGNNAYQQPDLFAQQTSFNQQQPQPTGGWPLVDTSFGQGSQFNVSLSLTRRVRGSDDESGS